MHSLMGLLVNVRPINLRVNLLTWQLHAAVMLRVRRTVCPVEDQLLSFQTIHACHQLYPGRSCLFDEHFRTSNARGKNSAVRKGNLGRGRYTST
jgi:hypothetical protein